MSRRQYKIMEMSKERLTAFTDAVLAIIMTILINLKR